MTVPREDCDLLVVGGGINGAGIARDAAGRGLAVVLCEQDDLAAHTSSASTKLIHGGLRYLEYYHFGLVRKSLLERERVLASAPHIMWPLRFIMPHAAHLRPAWMIRAGLLLYDHLARRRHLPGSASIDLHTHPAGATLEPRFARGFMYSDGWVDDARLVVLNAIDAFNRGASILTRTRCERIERVGSWWKASLVDRRGQRSTVQTRAVVNAAGPWVGEFLRTATPVAARRAVRLVKGSHIIVPRLFEHRFAYLFQAEDRRVVFAIPYQHDFTLLGTTDIEYQGDPGKPHIDPAETEYLCAMANRYLRRKIAPRDVVAAYSGLRPLLQDESADASSVTRDYALELDRAGAPLLSVFGGKITTYRKLAEEVLDRLAPLLDFRASSWTADALLPGGDLPEGSFAVFLRILERRYPWLPAALRQRYAHAYGTRVTQLLGHAGSIADLGVEILPGLHAREIDYLQCCEWAECAEDILWRRTKLGLHLPPEAGEQLERYLGNAGAAWVRAGVGR